MSLPAGAAERADEVAELVDLIDAVIYSDLFDCAVSEEEIWRFSRRPIERARLRELLADGAALRPVLSERDGLWCLRGREPLLGMRGERRLRARRLRRRSGRVAAVLARAPFVRGLLLTGSAAAGDADADADLDLLVLVEPGRLATVFAILGSASRLLGRELFCPNHYLAADALTIERRDIYVARELAQAIPVAGAATSLRRANPWVEEMLPNAAPAPELRTAARRPRLQRLLERPLRGRLGERLERRLRPLAHSRLAHHHRGHRGGVPERVAADLAAGRQLRFHGGIDADGLLDRYRRSRSEIAERLSA